MSSQLSEGQLVTYAIDEIVDTLSTVSILTDKCNKYDPNAGSLQRSQNQWFKPIEQQSRQVEGWDVTGQEGGVLELSIGGSLGEPKGTFFKLRADDVRDETSYRRRIGADAARIAGMIEQDIVNKVITHGSFAVTDSNAIGSTAFTAWDALARCSSKKFKLEMSDKETCALLNPADFLSGGRDLTQSTANYQSKIPDDAYRKGMMQYQVAGVDYVSQHNKLPVITGQATAVTVNGDQSFTPTSFVLGANGQNVNVDNRFASLTVSTTVGVNIGDKFIVPNMFAVSRDGKIESTDEMTFTVAAIESGTVMTISPRPYAWDERPVADGGSGALTRDEAAYANVSTSFNNGDVITWLNTTTGQANAFFTSDSITLASSPIPANHDIFGSLTTEGFSVGGINGIIGWEGNLSDLNGKCRIAVWYDPQVEKPEECGVFLGGQA